LLSDKKITVTALRWNMSLLDEYERLMHHVEAALEYAGNSHTALDVLDAIRSGKAQFFPYENSVIVTEIVDYPQKTSCRIWLAGGDMDELMEAEKEVAEWARGLGCSSMEIIGRKGWERQLNEYQATATLLMKEL